jgi:putative sigma-54 modulation protein
MRIHIRSRNGKVSDRQRAYVEEKLQKLERYMDGAGDITVELSHAPQRNAGEMYTVQATLHTAQGTILRAEERNPELFAAVDTIHDILQRQITRYKGKHYRRGKIRRLEADVVAVDFGEDEVIDNNAPQIVKTKHFAYKPMYSDEAIEQMELLGHSFFVFTDAQTNQVNVVYRRRDGNYGLIVPETR